MVTKYIAWDSGGGNIKLTYEGSGNGSITIESDQNNSASARSKTITINTTAGGVITKNLTVSQAACPFPVGQVNNYSYTGSYQEVVLPAGKYKLQCWGAQGGSNGTNSTYDITAQVGGKGGYSEGVITLTQKTTVRVYVGGQGSASSGGYNGGGSTVGTCQYDDGTTLGISKMGGGGGATDIRLSDGSLYSRMIVAGGGSGGAMCCKQVTTTTVTYTNVVTLDLSGITYHSTVGRRYVNNVYANNILFKVEAGQLSNGKYILIIYPDISQGAQWLGLNNGDVIRVKLDSTMYLIQIETSGSTVTDASGSDTIFWTVDKSAGGANFKILLYHDSTPYYGNVAIDKQITNTSVTKTTDSHVGYAGGGTNGVGYSSSYYGKQNAAGSGGGFGAGANQTAVSYRYCSGAGGSGWYGGGGGQKSGSSMTYCRYSGGGSGWVNIAANAGNRPSGYTGLELDSGETYAGNTSFPSTDGGTETGHSGNGYARITRIS